MSQPEVQEVGPVIIDLSGPQLAAEDRERLLHPSVGGIIHFARHFESPQQLRELNAEIRALRPRILIAVDHEGGRVQRFRDGFTLIPPMRRLGERWDTDPDGAAAEAQRLGRVIADELSQHGVDFSFTPVLDLDHGGSTVIGDRAFHRDPQAAAALGAALIGGLRAGGMASVGKHFPGHGFVRADSHHEVPIDERSYAELEADDLIPFARLIAAGLDAVMPAHVIYLAVDMQPAGYSEVWIRQILRGQLGFDGMIFSDDLGMAGAHGAGDMLARANLALAAGCDMVLVCNDLPAADALLERWETQPAADLQRRAARMRARSVE
ncbi:MAG: beta-N-acetylhexosaminidase [Betaproteobacteria bacterium]